MQACERLTRRDAVADDGRYRRVMHRVLVETDRRPKSDRASRVQQPA